VLYSYEEIKIQNINLAKRPFSFSFPEFDQKLFDSISNIGLANPPIILPACVHRTDRQKKNTNKYYVVSGIRRVLACKKLGIKALPCSIIKENTLDCEKFILLSLKINLSSRELNDIEKAHLFKLLNETGICREKIIRTYMPYLNLEKSRKIYEDIMSLNSLDTISKMRVIEWNLPLKISAVLARYQKSDRAAVMKMAEILMPGINRLKEIIMYLEEIALIQKCSISDLIKKYLVNMVKNSTICRKERTEMVRQKLKGLRYPQLAKMEREWNEFIKELHLPQDIKIIPPLSFEGKKIKLEVSFSNKDTLSRSLSKFNETLMSGSLVELINLVNTK
tara:strand:- start:19106 stop:20110 length:1005 start_codon:yes stop_codon:yes gene_type:complete